MSNWTYKAKDKQGKTVKGKLTAPDRSEAVAELQKRELIVLEIESGSGASKAKTKGGGGLGSITLGKVKPKATRTELVIFTRQLSTMVGAGISLLEAIDVLRDQAETPGMRLTCETVADNLRGGTDLSAALASCPKVFNTLYVSMVAAGEVSGQMDIVLDRLADYQEASDELVKEVKAAMTYPVISMCLVLAITAFLMLYIVPTFAGIFEEMDAELPALTAFVLGTSDWMRANVVTMVLIAGVAISAIVAFKKTPRGTKAFDILQLRLPVFGPLLKKVALARFSRTFGTLIKSGVPILGTLDIVAKTAGNEVIAEAVRASSVAVSSGDLLSEPLSESKVFPPMVVRMIAIGERSGALETLLEKIAEFYDREVKAQIKSLTSLIEPILISVMGIIVGGVVMSVFLPIIDIVGQLGGK
ncbi:MAG: type II secretion system F family protein [Planctomycetota bacterium]|jgi:type IV pilus assembly protein PilC|nr:type II secretion system F family protein [Planctomycetota bacterium]MDG2144009.1 type II secretion system F family protein [Planctomycetota bacterium]